MNKENSLSILQDSDTTALSVSESNKYHEIISTIMDRFTSDEVAGELIQSYFENAANVTIEKVHALANMYAQYIVSREQITKERVLSKERMTIETIKSKEQQIKMFFDEQETARNQLHTTFMCILEKTDLSDAEKINSVIQVYKIMHDKFDDEFKEKNKMLEALLGESQQPRKKSFWSIFTKT